MSPPQLTRDAKFRASFDVFATCFARTLSEGPEFHYSLEKCSDHDGKKLHKYTLCLQPTEGTPPPLEYFEGYFYAYYSLFYQHRNSVVGASVEFEDGHVCQHHNVMTGNIYVTHHQHLSLPYPHDGIYPFKAKEYTMSDVLFRNIMLQQSHQHLQSTVQDLMDNNAEWLDRSRIARTNTDTVFRQTYQKLDPNAWHTCSVCYTGISPDLLEVPLCFHLICRNCKERCDKCPECRMLY